MKDQKIYLEVTLINNQLNVWLKNNPSQTATNAQQKTVTIEEINQQCLQLISLINASNKKQHNDRINLLNFLKQQGLSLYTTLFTSDIQKILQTTDAHFLILTIDNQLVQIPWEILFDGKKFLCQRFCMGRLVKVNTSQNISMCRNLDHSDTFKMLILIPPDEHLPETSAEGMKLVKLIEKKAKVSYQTTTKTAQLKKRMCRFDMVHFAGHAFFNQNQLGQNGWKLKDGVFKTDDIKALTDSYTTMPIFIFSNACQSARIDDWDAENINSLGLASAFMIAGVKHYIGSAYEILDTPARKFSTIFYKYLIKGKTVGESLRQSRIRMMNDPFDISWAAYIHYGDPSEKFFSDKSLNGFRYIRYFFALISIVFAVFLLTYTYSPVDTFFQSSRPLTLAVVYPDKKKDFDQDKKEFITGALQFHLNKKYKRVKLVSLSDEITAEIERRKMFPMDDEYDLDFKILPVQLKLEFRLNNYESPSNIFLYLITMKQAETAETFVYQMGSDHILDQSEKIVDELIQTLKDQYPLQGIILSVEEEHYIIDIGTDVGVTKALRFKVLNTDVILQVISRKKDISRVKKIQGTALLKKGMPVVLE